MYLKLMWLKCNCKVNLSSNKPKRGGEISKWGKLTCLIHPKGKTKLAENKNKFIHNVKLKIVNNAVLAKIREAELKANTKILSWRTLNDLLICERLMWSVNYIMYIDSWIQSTASIHEFQNISLLKSVHIPRKVLPK